MRLTRVGLVLVGAVVFTGHAGADGDPAAGAKKAILCAACHGPNGISANPLWPNLAGQNAAYLETQIKAFRDGVRAEPTMAPFVQTLTDQDAGDLAAHFAAMRCGE